MSDECTRKECVICGNRIQGANYYCPDCKLHICFKCGVKIALTERAVWPSCPNCGNELT